jgi:hypothetical protein
MCKVVVESLDRLNIEMIPIWRLTHARWQAKRFWYKQPAG